MFEIRYEKSLSVVIIVFLVLATGCDEMIVDTYPEVKSEASIERNLASQNIQVLVSGSEGKVHRRTFRVASNDVTLFKETALLGAESVSEQLGMSFEFEILRGDSKLVSRSYLAKTGSPKSTNEFLNALFSMLKHTEKQLSEGSQAMHSNAISNGSKSCESPVMINKGLISADNMKTLSFMHYKQPIRTILKTECYTVCAIWNADNAITGGYATYCEDRDYPILTDFGIGYGTNFPTLCGNVSDYTPLEF